MQKKIKALNKIKDLETRLIATLQGIPEIGAAILFGSILKAPELARDVDILLVLAPKADVDEVLTKTEQALIEAFPEVSVEKFDLVPFLPGPVDPYIILEATRQGKILFNRNNAYQKALERLSRYFTLNEIVLKPQERELYGIEP
ncbi:nucleotidyltransferase domain-containing protein [Thermodesulfatator atlanticus]|uniref:nucleotidyltransferase domain-containing protein n=1 Tax=Thermodesulfatator atlanticus TaxID=501497 RepID=UPI0003B5192C|nr:nucleotidyltransferase domain-containing protein [Thermodesulfatator atlanticus]